MSGVGALLCPVCAEPAQDAPPSPLRPGSARLHPSRPRRWSHLDGSPMCPAMPVIGGDYGGYLDPVEPVEVVPRTLTADEVRTLDGFMFNYGPFDPADVLDVVDLLAALNTETGDLGWADVSAVFAYYRCPHALADEGTLGPTAGPRP